MFKDPKLLLIERGKTIKQAMRQMKDVAQKQLFLAESDGRLLGVISDGDIRKWILDEGALSASVEDVCNRNPVVVEGEYELEQVKSLLLYYKIEAVPVVDFERRVIDVLVWDEVFREEPPKVREKINIPVVIMAGGKGTRLDPFTKVFPKSLIPIGDKPVIEHILDKFIASGVKEFYLSINHKAKMIKAYFEERQGHYGICYLEEKDPLGTAGSLQLLKGRIEGTFLVTNCDIIIDTDYEEIVRFHQENHFEMTVVVSCKRHVIPYGVCEVHNGGVLKSICEKPEYDLLINTGMYVMESKFLSLIPEGKMMNINELIEKAKNKGYRVGVFPIDEKSWIDIGQWDEYQKAIKHLQFVSGD